MHPTYTLTRVAPPVRLPFRGTRHLERHAALLAAAIDCRPTGPSWETLERHGELADRTRVLHPIVRAALSGYALAEVLP